MLLAKQGKCNIVLHFRDTECYEFASLMTLCCDESRYMAIKLTLGGIGRGLGGCIFGICQIFLTRLQAHLQAFLGLIGSVHLQEQLY